MSLPVSITRLCFWAHCLRPTTAIFSSSAGIPLIPSSLEHPYVLRPGSAHPLYGAIGGSPTTLLVLAPVGLSSIPQAATFYLTTKLQHPSLLKAGLVTGSIFTRRTRARQDLFLTMAEVIQRMGLVPRCGLKRAVEVQYREPCRTRVPNRRAKTSASRTLTWKPSEQSQVSV